MPTTLRVRPPSCPLLVDGPLRLSLLLTNEGAEEVSLPGPGQRSPFRYSVFAADGTTLITSASLAQRRDAEGSTGHLAPERKLPQRVLAPHDSAGYEDDLGALLVAPLAPGRYLVEASFESAAVGACTAPRVPLELVVSAPEARAQALSEDGSRVVIAEWHREGPSSVLLRVSERGIGPLGRFQTIQALETAGPVGPGGVSLAAAYGLPRSWHWLAWLEGDRLCAGVAFGGRWLPLTKTLDLPLASPSLLPFGYTLGDSSALFLLEGRGSSGKELHVVRVPARNDGEPTWVRLKGDELPEGPLQATCIWTPDGDPEIVLAWHLNVRGAELIVLGRHEGRTGEALAPPRGAFVTLRAILAFALPAVVTPESSAWASLVLGPAADGAPVTVARFDVRRPHEQTSEDLPRCEGGGFALSAVARWVLPSGATPSPTVLAVVHAPQTRTAALTTAATTIWAVLSAGWQAIAEGKIEPASVRLWVLSPDRELCTWFDAERGYRSVWLPAAAAISVPPPQL